jgi:hypothetical protein
MSLGLWQSSGAAGWAASDRGPAARRQARSEQRGCLLTHRPPHRPSQLQQLSDGFPSNSRAYAYYFTTVAAAYLLGLLVYGTAVWVQ